MDGRGLRNDVSAWPGASSDAKPPIEDLIPHQPPMVWLDELIDWSWGYARCRARITRDTALVKDGSLHAVALIEYMAQSVAACLGYGALQSGEDVRVGMIVACRSFDFHRERVPVGTELIVQAHLQREVDAVSNFECSVESGGAPIAAAQMTLYHASEPPA